jgi:transposase
MRGRSDRQNAMFITLDVEALVPPDHPLRPLKRMADGELGRLQPHFNAAYAKTGRPSIPPEQMIKASLLQALYSIRSERQLCEQIGYNFLFRWFVDLSPEAPAWNHSTFTKNRERFAEHGLLQSFFDGTVAHAIEVQAAGSEHFSVDGTLIQAWGSMKSFRPKNEPDDPDGAAGEKTDANAWADFKGQKRSNATHRSRTDPEARLARKGPGQAAVLAHSMHLLMDNRHGLLLDVSLAEANGYAEREMAEAMLRRVRKRHGLRPKTLGADAGYDDGGFLMRLENKQKVVPHVPTRPGKIVSQSDEADARRRARRRAKNKGYTLSQRCRKRIEEIFSWMKTVAGMRHVRFVGRWKIQLQAMAAGACYNLMRLAKDAEA